jgi:hypothetical protein
MLIAILNEGGECFTGMAQPNLGQVLSRGMRIIIGNELLKTGPRLVEITFYPAYVHR